MPKRDILKIALILSLLSGVSKILSLLIKILIARTLSSEALTYYSLCAPTMVFFIAIAQLGLPATISKLVADQHLKNEEPMLASIIISLINNLLLVIILIIIIPILATIFLKNSNLKNILYAIVVLLPLVTLSGIIKGYFVGKGHHIKSSMASIIEEVTRGIFILLAFNLYPDLSDINMAVIAMLSISVGELGTIIYLSYDLIRRKKYFTRFHSLNANVYKNVLNLALPLTAARLFGSFTFFIEPFVLSFCALPQFLNNYQNFYGLIQGYALPILTLPNFISFTLANYILPSFTYEYSLKHYKRAKQMLLTTIGLNLFIAFSTSIIIFLFPQFIVDLLYKKGSLLNINDLLRTYTFLFAACSCQAILSAALQAANKAKPALIDTMLGCIVRILIIALGINIFKEQTIISALYAGMFTTTILHILRVGSLFFQHDK